MGTRRRAVVAAFLPALSALIWPVAGTTHVSAATEPATCTADGTALQVTAEDNTFDKGCMAVPPGQAFTIELDNKDLLIAHNVSLYDPADGGKALYKGELIYGPRKVTYSVPAQAKGTYEFICDRHHESMRGTFIVG